MNNTEKDNIIKIINKIHQKKPLIHHITNIVVSNITANLTLALGALPIMAIAREEVAEIAEATDVLLVNIGTITKEVMESILIAGLYAKEKNKKIILDPVGAGATSFRTEASLKIMETVQPDIVKGNFAEMLAISGKKAWIKGVESLDNDTEKMEDSLKSIALRYNCIAAATSETDILSNGETTKKLAGGHPLLKYVTGTGCMATTAIACFMAIENPFDATYHGLKLMKSSDTIKNVSGPVEFQNTLIDTIFQLSKIDVADSGFIQNS